MFTAASPLYATETASERSGSVSEFRREDMPPTLADEDILSLLFVRGDEREDLFARARKARAATFGPRVVTRGLIEITNLCRVNCEFCPMRRDNARQNAIFHMSVDQILDAAREIKSAGINIVFLQAGEVPRTTETVAECIPRILDLYDGEVEILLCLGNKPRTEYEQLKSLGATSYILKHETSDPLLNRRMRHSSFDERVACLETLHELGYMIGTGTIIGLPGQSLDSLIGDIRLAVRLGAHMFSASPFVPAPDTPLAHEPPGDIELTLNFLAVSRLINPSWLIPSVSALEKTAAGGQAAGLNAGANVLTINFTPDSTQGRYLIYGKDRFIVKKAHAARIISEAGLEFGPSVFVAAPSRPDAAAVR
jgi:biotin synthase